MISIKSDFAEKQIEAELLIEHVRAVSSAKSSVNTASILKSAFILMLYNMTESTTRSSLERVHEKISRHDYSKLSDKIKKLSVDFYFKNANDNRTCLDKALASMLFFPSLNEFEKKIKLFSGNLDVREINRILNKYGIGKIQSANSDKLLTVKNKRNRLAHGEDMFKESCRNMTVNELCEIREATIDILSQLIDVTEKYLLQERYLF